MKDYKKILENVVNIINTTEKSDIGFANICTYIGENCPELKESEDERIKKATIEFVRQNKSFNHCLGISKEDAIAWLEKQKTSEEALQYLKENHSTSEVSDFQAAMNIAVAKAYDKGYNDGLEKQGEQKLANSAKTCKDEQKPTDEEMKTLLRIEYEKGRADAIAEMQKPVDCIDCTNSKGCINCEDGNMKETLVQKPAWSEEDEAHINGIMDYLLDYKLLANEEDMNVANGVQEEINWLKSLKPQPHWKPTKDQMEALHDLNLTGNISYAGQGQVLIELYKQLEKL